MIQSSSKLWDEGWFLVFLYLLVRWEHSNHLFHACLL